MEPLRHIIRHKKASVKFYEAEATKIDHEKRVVFVKDNSDIQGDVNQTEVPFDYLVIGVGAENATFGKWLDPCALLELSRSLGFYGITFNWRRVLTGTNRHSGCQGARLLLEGDS